MRLILVHGAFQDGRVWDKLAGILQQKDYQVDIVNLPGRKGSSDPKAVRLEDYVQAIVSTIREQGQEVVLLCHSFAGIHGAVAASRCLDQIKGIVFLAANISAEGETTYSLLHDYPKIQGEIWRATQNSGLLPKNDNRAKVLTAKCEEKVKNNFYDNIFQEEPALPYFEDVHYEDDWAFFLKDRIRYYIGTEDKAIDASHAMSYAKKAGTNPIMIPGGDHQLMLSRPEELAVELFGFFRLLEGGQ